jgi:hypothetical protein
MFVCPLLVEGAIANGHAVRCQDLLLPAVCESQLTFLASILAAAPEVLTVICV